MNSAIEDLPYGELKEWIRSNIDVGKIPPEIAVELARLLKKKKSQERKEQWRTDPLIWSEDRLGIKPETVKWSLNEGYENHKWDSRIHSRVKMEDGTWDFPHTPCPDPLWEVGKALARQEPRITMPSSTGTGKTWWAARLVLWFLEVYGPYAKVITYATKQEQLRINLWAEIERSWTQFKELYPDAALLRGSLRLYMDNTSESARETWSARGRGADVRAGEAAAGGAKGSHAPNQLFIFEEGQSADPAILKSIIDGATGPNNIIMMLGNPLGEYDQLYQMSTKPHVTWISISSLDHPNVVLDDPYYIPGAVDRKHIQMAIDDCDGDLSHPDYLGPIRGIFPLGGARSIISNRLAEKVKPFLQRPETCIDNGQYYEAYETSDDFEVEGYCAFYKQPRMDYVRWCYIAMDIAGDKADGDWSVAIFYDRVDNEPFGYIRMRGDRSFFYEQVVKHAYRNATFWGARGRSDLPLISWERNFHSPARDTVIGQYPNLYRPMSMDSKKKKMGSTIGFHTNKKTRIELQERIKEWLRDCEASIEGYDYSPLYIPDLHYELTKFVAQEKSRKDDKTVFAAAPGFHDDVVMAFGQVVSIHVEHEHLPPLPIGQQVHEVNRERLNNAGTGYSYQQANINKEQVGEYNVIDSLQKWKPKQWRR